MNVCLYVIVCGEQHREELIVNGTLLILRVGGEI